MRKVMFHNLKRLIAALVLFIVCVSVFFARGSFSVALAAESKSYDETNVLDDLKDSTIAGEAFDLSDYSFQQYGRPQLISFIEFGYSFYADRRDDYGLYIYVYNPQGVAFDTETDRNSIEFKAGNSPYYKKPLQFLNYSTQANYEGMFYKFKVVLSDTEKTAVLSYLEQDARVYRVVGIELSVGGEVEDYEVGSDYIYKGYALGYGSDLQVSDGLTCDVNGFKEYLSLDVHSTYYRPEGTNGKSIFTHDNLQSVYFTVPNEAIEEWGTLYAVHGRYLKALSSNMFVTGDNTYYERFLSVLGQDLGYMTDENDPFPYWFFSVDDMWWGGIASSIFYHVTESYANREGTDAFYLLAWLFNASNGDADTYNVSMESIFEYMDWYSETYPTDKPLVSGRYSPDLFSEVADEFTEFTVTADEKTKDLQSTVLDRTWWNKTFGGVTEVSSTAYEGKQAVYAVQDDDFVFNAGTSELNYGITSDNLYVAEGDLDAFKAEYELAKAHDETLYLIRFAVDDYVAAEARQAKLDHIGAEGTPFEGGMIYSEDNTNCYIGKQYIYLDFDIIDLTFNKDNVKTVIPVVMSPMDITSDLTPPAVTTDDDDDWWKIVLAVLCLIILLVILMPILPYLVKAVVWVIALPFKLIGAIFKGIGNAVKKRKRSSAPKSTSKKKRRNDKQ